MDLKGINVLVDGYNLELAAGTGIKTYGISLVRALELLGANVGILFSSNKPFSENPILNEILFFDIYENNRVSANLFEQIFRTTLGLGFKIKRVTRESGIVIKDGFNDGFMDTTKFYNFPNCYKIANALYRVFKITPTFTISKEKVDIWHATYPLPIMIKKTKKITTIHDLVPLRLPYTTLDDKKVYFMNIQKSLKESAIIIAVSENTKRDLLNTFEVNSDKIYVTYQPVILKSLPLKEEEISGILRRYHLSFQNYLLFVGAIEPKKNIGRLIDAYHWADPEIPLVIVGKKAWLWESQIGRLEGIFGKNLQKRVKLLEYISAEDLIYLYQGAYCLVFPSLYEGFGLPPLEAMTLGCPVITSEVASLPEICGDAALYVDPYSVNDIRNKIEMLLNNPDLRKKLSKAGKERAKLFGMENYVRKLYEAYSKVL